jgi:RNA polymerase sigma-70 factor (ECF subfamily)
LDNTKQPTSFLERLFTESAEDLKRYFSRRHGVGEWVEDLVQETFLQMARGLEGGRKLDCARGYLFGIARRLSLAAWRSRAEEKVVPFDAAASDLEAPGPEDDRITAARETIAGLDPIQREILDLRFSQGLSYSEIAEVLSIPIGTVRSRLHHAVAAVRQRLETDHP